MKGGYKILDFSGIDFESGSGQTIAGTYDKLESSTKATLIESLSVGGTEYNSQWANFTLAEGTFTATLPDNITVTVSQEDLVTVTKSE